MSALFSFPDPVNEKAARVVAGVVLATAVLVLLTGAYWLLAVLAYGFWARVLTGPTLSPLGRFAMKVAAPRLGEPRYVPGPPKRFAQAMGAAITTAGAVAALGFGATGTVDVLLGLLVVAAGLPGLRRLRLPDEAGLRAADGLRALRQLSSLRASSSRSW
jgi:hypothetical protein